MSDIVLSVPTRACPPRNYVPEVSDSPVTVRVLFNPFWNGKVGCDSQELFKNPVGMEYWAITSFSKGLCFPSNPFSSIERAALFSVCFPCLRSDQFFTMLCGFLTRVDCRRISPWSSTVRLMGMSCNDRGGRCFGVSQPSQAFIGMGSWLSGRIAYAGSPYTSWMCISSSIEIKALKVQRCGIYRKYAILPWASLEVHEILIQG
ncbi:hypothetical protein PAXRUDRAFT_421088 [Paxillus rubicundulus Ve08.2h10]|uniref:Uncharacterized protein n=1 Tax=Paxillus rubicundulus Ve08.2h10 TaxID=930991 RepID=A0A0D0E2K6_9AGAM|nr:hypothetical protein PAXRUDRAFT_421088 [Paxillus rubicundulus Ve08.2h10]